MPLPTPNNREKKSDFIARCMSSDMIKKDFKDNNQKLSVCYSQFEDAKKDAKASAEFGDEEIIIVESEKDYDHEMTISKEKMEELHEKGETYITERDGEQTMVIKVNYDK